MDDLGSRASTAGRRMATARPTATVRRGSSTTGRSGTATPEIPPARWAGVALVIAALLGTILLAVVSPGDDDAPSLAVEEVLATEPPTATVVPGSSGRIPTAQPKIRQPRDGTLEREVDIPVTVEVPQDPIPSRELSLVILRDGQEVKRVERPGRGKVVKVGGVRLVPGRNELTAALAGPGGLGPASEPVVITHDTNAPELLITAPEPGTETFDDQVSVAITSEPGAMLKVRNQATKRDSSETVGPSGTALVTVRLAMGRNRIVVTSTDPAGLKQEEAVVVLRIDGEPRIALTAPKQVRRGELPKRVTVSVVVTDARDQPIPDATVTWSLSGSGWETQSTEDTTDGDGRSTWRPPVEAGTSDEPIRVSAEVVVDGRRGSTYKEIRVN